ncbi:MAG: POT family proton-dependent oligopeptide transporter [Halioglobus sp.]|jgi:POT family proton-dependent oligopeptide transporter
MQKITDQSHTKHDLILLLSKLFERSSYYGLRAILVLYLIGGPMKMPTEDAMFHYAWFTAGLLFFGIVGALFGDLFLGNKRAFLLGGALQSLGAFILSIPSTTTLYIGIGLVCIGGGFFGSNLLSCFGKTYRNRPKLLDSAFSIYYLIINLGAALGIYIIGIVGEKHGWSLGFILSGLLMLIALILSYFHYESNYIETKPDKISYDNAIINILVTFVVLGLFWAINDIVYHKNIAINISYSESSSNLGMVFWSSINFYIMVPLSIILASIWAYFYSNSYIKLSIGFLFGALSYGLLLFIPERPLEQHLIIYLASILSFVISEAFIVPVVYSIITRYANPKYLATIASLVFLTNKAFFYFNGFFNDYLDSTSFYAILYSMVGMIVIGLVLLVFMKKNEIDRSAETLDS